MPAPSDETVRTISAGGGIAVRALVGTQLVAEAAQRHGLSPVATIALGRSLMGAALLGLGGQDDETFQLDFNGDGPIGSITALSDAAGHVRGYVGNPGAVAPPQTGPLDIAAVVGDGLLAVVRNRPGWKAPYRGVVPLATGTIAQDLAHYLERSEQTRSAVALGVFLDDDARVTAAGGYFASVLPGADDGEIAQVEANVRGFPGPGELIQTGQGAVGIVEHLLAGLGSGPLERGSVSFACPCERGRALRTLSLLGEDDLTETAARGESLEVRCEFCGDRYEIEPDELRGLARGTGSSPAEGGGELPGGRGTA
jgi:molecular chaperone Hsp33